MKRHHHKYLIIAIAMLSALAGVEAFAVDTQPTAVPTTVQTPIANAPTTAPTSVATQPATVPAQTSTVQPASSTNLPAKPEDRPSPILKFLLAMFGVLLSSLAILYGLKLYKKFVLKNNSKTDNINYGNSFESPKTFKEAINIFLDKTDK